MAFGLKRYLGFFLGTGAAAPSEPPTTNLVLRLMADAGVFTDTARTVPATLDGDAIAGWADQGVEANHGVQATVGNRPTLKLSQVNGKPALRFDGTSDYIDVADAVSLRPGTSAAWTVAFITKRTGAMAANFGIIIGKRAYASGADHGWGLAYDGTTTKMATHIRSAGNIDGHTITEPAMQSLTSMATAWQSWLLEENNDDDRTKWYLNGTLDQDVAVNQYANVTNTEGVTIGGGNGFLYFDGDVAEIMIWKGLLTAGEKTQLASYITGKYGL